MDGKQKNKHVYGMVMEPGSVLALWQGYGMQNNANFYCFDSLKNCFSVQKWTCNSVVCK